MRKSPDLQDQQYKIPLKIEGKTDRTAKGYTLVCAIFRLVKTSLHQVLEKLSENRLNGFSIKNNGFSIKNFAILEMSKRKIKQEVDLVLLFELISIGKRKTEQSN